MDQNPNHLSYLNKKVKFTNDLSSGGNVNEILSFFD